ncbi:MAG: divergent polysaccharide deacetylase family protein [Proteobacteria bacterium]|nr:divergent polysaccharide deacetylase family protein [Pseudomonadota bacterium]
MALRAWVRARHWPTVAAVAAVLFLMSLVGGYWLAQRIDRGDRDRLVHDTLQDMKRGGAQQTPAAPPKYASIDQIPGFPKYKEADHPLATIEEKPRPRSQPPQLAAASATSAMWRRNAVPFADLHTRPLIAIVIDDVGLDRPHSKRAWELPGPITLSFLPYAKDLREQARAAHARGQELMLHLPMEPMGRADPGPGALLVSLGESELRQRVTTALDSFDGYVGVNNHMGSRFTANKPGMETAMRLFKARGLMFLDSRTTAQTVAEQTAQELGVPTMQRNVFLDDDEAIDQVRRRLAETEAVARRQGFVVAIGHPHEATLQALAEWLPGLQAKGFALAPATAVLRKRNGWD